MEEKISIKFPNGDTKSYSKHITPLEIAQSISSQLAKKIIAAKFNEQIIDISRELGDNGDILFLTPEDQDGLNVLWHSTAHVMAHAVKQLYPEAKFGFGPAIENGFYYDIDVGETISVDDFAKIENKMAELIASNQPFIREELSKKDAKNLFAERDEPYKLEHIKELGDSMSIYHENGFVDLCSGPHIPSTSFIKHFKLLSVSGAYWKGDEKRPMLQRIYGISYPKKNQLDEYLLKLEEAKKRDHRKLGRELDLFSIVDDVGSGLILWHPKGGLIRKLIEDFWRDEHLRAGYEIVYTPHIARLNLWEKSGHLDFFTENMFTPLDMDNVQYQLKPMNCPFHLSIYKSRGRSYRDLPIRWAELGTVYRYERSGVLHGLMRVRGFTQDDAHIFCRPDQLEQEIIRCIEFMTFILKSFGFEKYDVYLSTRPENYVGTIENWEKATDALKGALEKVHLDYVVDPGEGVFYGPKIDIKIKDVLDRSWQCSTIQVDFNEPDRFNLTYKGQDGAEHQPIMIHRALMGSLERFFGIMIEHYAGAFPVWLAPVQMMLLPITDSQHEYANKVRDLFQQNNIRVQLDDRNEKIGYKIREAELQKIPYMCVIGEKEVSEDTLSLRKHKDGDQGTFSIDDVVNLIRADIESKK